MILREGIFLPETGAAEVRVWLRVKGLLTQELLIQGDCASALLMTELSLAVESCKTRHLLSCPTQGDRCHGGLEGSEGRVEIPSPHIISHPPGVT